MRTQFDSQARVLFSHPVQYINSAQIRFYTNALTSVLQSVAPQLAEISGAVSRELCHTGCLHCV